MQPQWWTTKDPSTLPYESTLRVLRSFYNIHGDLVIPRNFVVPSSNEYPVEWHGVKLSAYVYTRDRFWSKHIAERKDRVAQLGKLGFLWERLVPEWNLLIEALSVYKSIHGDVLVPAKFIVPRTGEWSKACWEMPLGSMVQRIRIRHDYLTGDNSYERRLQLGERASFMKIVCFIHSEPEPDRLGFVYDVSEVKFAKFLAAVKYFRAIKRQHSTVRIPSKYVVPQEKGWPEELWDYPLGARSLAVRQKQLYVKGRLDRQNALEEVGFMLQDGNAKLGWLAVVQAAAIYSQMHNKVLNVPLNFVVPAPPLDADVDCYETWPWPRRLWGLKLGQRLKDVRQKNAYLKGSDAEIRRAQLNQLGFVWTPKRGRRKRFVGETEDFEQESCLLKDDF